MKVIEVQVAPDGKVVVETRGFVGQECRAASRFVEVALGERTNEQLTAEFHRNQMQERTTNRLT
jgi:hypothetical protein